MTVISQPLMRYPSRAQDVDEISPRRSISPPLLSASPPPSRPKSSIFSRLRRDTLPSGDSASYEQPPKQTKKNDKEKERGKKDKDRWSKLASRKAPPPPPVPLERQLSEEFELDWERIRTLPRVRLVPPEDEGEPVMLYPIPHPSSLLPLPPSPSSPPTLLQATIAATSLDTDPDAERAIEPPRAPTPPSGVTLNSLAHATSSAAGQHGHWIGMSDKFILPPPVFARGHANRRIVMPKTRKQLQADIGRRMSMHEQRRRDSLEIERNILLPPLEEAAQSPPNVMLPPISSANEDIDDDEPLARIVKRYSGGPTSPPANRLPIRKESLNGLAEADSRSRVTDNLVRLERVMSEGANQSGAGGHPRQDVRRGIETAMQNRKQLIKPLIDLAELTPRAISATAPPAPTPVPEMESAADSSDTCGESISGPTTRKKRAKSLSSALARSKSDEGPSPTPPPIQIAKIKKQRSLKKLFFPSSESIPDVPPVPTSSLPSSSNAAGGSPISRMNSSDDQGESNDPINALAKRSSNARTKSRPGLKITVQSSKTTDTSSRTPITPGLTTASTTNEVYPSTPLPDDRPTHGFTDSARPQSAKAISKRFSLSNMSAAFRRKGSVPSVPGQILHDAQMSANAKTVPEVPVLPQEYRKPKQESSGDVGTSSRATEPAISIPHTALSTSIEQPESTDQPDDDLPDQSDPPKVVHAPEPPVIRRHQSFDIVRESLALLPERKKTSTGPTFSSFDGQNGQNGQTSGTIKLLPSPSIISNRAPYLPPIGGSSYNRTYAEGYGSPGSDNDSTCAFEVDFEAEMSMMGINMVAGSAFPDSPALASSEGCGVHGNDTPPFSPGESMPPEKSPLSLSHTPDDLDNDRDEYVQDNGNEHDDDDDEGSICSLDESTSIVHAHLMHVSPTTRRNPSVSLQEFLGMAPASQAVVVQGNEKRKSVQAIVQGPLLFSSETPVEDKSDTLQEGIQQAASYLSRLDDGNAYPVLTNRSSSSKSSESPRKSSSPVTVVEYVSTSPPGQMSIARASAPAERDSIVDQGSTTVSADVSRRCSAEEAEIKMAAPLVIDLRGQYARRVTRTYTAPTPPQMPEIPARAHSMDGPRQKSTAAEEVMQDTHAEALTKIMSRSDSASSSSSQALPTTPSALALIQFLEPDLLELDMASDGASGMNGVDGVINVNHDHDLPRVETMIHLPGIDFSTSLDSARETYLEDSQGDGCISTESGLVLVDSPTLPPGWLDTPPSRPSRGTEKGSGGSGSATPKSRFPTPELLLRLLHSPRSPGGSRRSSKASFIQSTDANSSASTTTSVTSSKAKAATTATTTASSDPKYNKPLPHIEGMPRNSLDGYTRPHSFGIQRQVGEEGREEKWTYIGKGLELDEACFGGLGLDLGVGESGGIESRV